MDLVGVVLVVFHNFPCSNSGQNCISTFNERLQSLVVPAPAAWILACGALYACRKVESIA